MPTVGARGCEEYDRIYPRKLALVRTRCSPHYHVQQTGQPHVPNADHRVHV